MAWDKQTILRKLRQLHDSGRDISYNQAARRMQPLVSAAAYHFGSYRAAVAKAGIDYVQVTRRPRWTKPSIIRVIKHAKREGKDLHWSAAIANGGELAKAAFAAIQPRLFANWDRALQAAGLDADEISPYRRWNRHNIVFELRQRAQNRDPLNSGAIQISDPGLHAAAVRHFKSYDAALIAARIDPAKTRRRNHWNKEAVVTCLKTARRKGEHLSDSVIRKNNPPLYGAAIRLFGSLPNARAAAGIEFKSQSGPRAQIRK